MSRASKSTIILDFIFSNLDERLSKLEKLDESSSNEIRRLQKKADLLTGILDPTPPSPEKEPLSIFDSFLLNYDNLFRPPAKKPSPEKINREYDQQMYSESEIEDIIMHQTHEPIYSSNLTKDFNIDSEEQMSDAEGMNPFAPKFEIPRDYIPKQYELEKPIVDKKEIKSFSKYKNIRMSKSPSKKNFESSEDSESSMSNFEMKYTKIANKSPVFQKKSSDRKRSPSPSKPEKIEKKMTQDSGMNTEPALNSVQEKTFKITESPPRKIAVEPMRLEFSTGIKKDISTEMEPSEGFSFREKTPSRKVSESFVNLGFRTPENTEMWDDYQQIKQNYRFLRENKFELRAYTPQPRKSQASKSGLSRNTSEKRLTSRKNEPQTSMISTKKINKEPSTNKLPLSTAESIPNSSLHSTRKTEVKRNSPENQKTVSHRISKASPRRTSGTKKSKSPERKKVKEEIVLIYSPDSEDQFSKSINSSLVNMSNTIKLPPRPLQSENQMNYSLVDVKPNCSLYDYTEFQSAKPEFHSNKKFKSPMQRRMSRGSSITKSKPQDKISEKVEKYQKKATNEFSPERISTNKKPKKFESPSNSVVIVEWNENYS